mgnify:CR=1 FL=1
MSTIGDNGATGRAGGLFALSFYEVKVGDVIVSIAPHATQFVLAPCHFCPCLQLSFASFASSSSASTSLTFFFFFSFCSQLPGKSECLACSFFPGTPSRSTLRLYLYLSKWHCVAESF